MRTLHPMVFVLPVVLASMACGKGFSESLDGGQGQGADSGPPGEDSGPPPFDDGGEDAGCGSEPGFVCGGQCGGYSAPECIDGEWTCAPTNGTDCIIDDAGPDACAGESPICGPGDECWSSTAICENGAWSCVTTLGECDAQPPPPPEDSGPSLFACGDQACDPNSSYCQIMTGGPVNPDGGASSGYACINLPPSCAAGSQASCDCVQAWEGVSTCSCIAENGDVIMTCDIP